MDPPREHPPSNPPSTFNADGDAAAEEDKRPPRAQRRAREVTSRYMMAVASPAVHPSSSSYSSAGGPPACAALPPPPPRKPLPKQKHHQQSLFPPAAGAAASVFTPSADAERARGRRSPSPQARRPPTPSSLEIGDSDGDGSWYGDENRPEAPPPLTVSRSLETPIPSGLLAKAPGTQRRRVVRLFREIGGAHQQPSSPSEHQMPPETFNSRVVESRFLVRKARPGTPVVHLPERATSAATTPRPMAESQAPAWSVNARTAPRRTPTSQVSRSLQETLAGAGQVPRVPGTPHPPPSDREINGRSVETSPEDSTATDFSVAETCSISSPGGLCESPPICNQSSRARVSSECRSSMPEADFLPTMSSRLLVEGNSHQLDGITSSSSSHRGLTSSLCHRSLNSALSSCQQRSLNPTMSISRLPTPLRTPSGPVRAEAVYLPPQPATGKVSLDSRKGRKISSRQEESHTLRLLENRYLQWRFVNAKAQVAVLARRIAAERSLCGVSAKLSELHDSVMEKSSELGQLKRMKTVSTVLEGQMPYLGEWATLEDDCSNSLSGAIKSLQDASLRLPIIGNVRADINELGEALHSATNVLEALAPRVGCLETKADGTQTLLSDLAKVVCKERALIEEFGELFAEAHKLQVNECSLRAHLLQLIRAGSVQISVES